MLTINQTIPGFALFFAGTRPTCLPLWKAVSCPAKRTHPNCWCALPIDFHSCKLLAHMCWLLVIFLHLVISLKSGHIKHSEAKVFHTLTLVHFDKFIYPTPSRYIPRPAHIYIKLLLILLSLLHKHQIVQKQYPSACYDTICCTPLSFQELN